MERRGAARCLFPVAIKWPRFEGGGSRPWIGLLLLFEQACEAVGISDKRTEGFGLQVPFASENALLR